MSDKEYSGDLGDSEIISNIKRNLAQEHNWDAQQHNWDKQQSHWKKLFIVGIVAVIFNSPIGQKVADKAFPESVKEVKAP